MGEKKVVSSKGKKWEALFVSDWHVPFQDDKAISLTLKILKEHTPDYVIFGGDLIDAYNVSSFRKRPDMYNLQEEFDRASVIVEKYMSASPKSKFVFLEGNHEDRITRSLMENPQFWGLRNLELSSLWSESLGFGVDVYSEFLIDGYLFKHGTKANKYSANSELDLEDVSGMSGHVHRIQRMTRSNRNRIITWDNVGHLADIKKLEYVQRTFNGNPNWQQGYGYVTYKNGVYTVDNNPIFIKNGYYQTFFRGKLYKVKK